MNGLNFSVRNVVVSGRAAFGSVIAMADSARMSALLSCPEGRARLECWGSGHRFEATLKSATGPVAECCLWTNQTAEPSIRLMTPLQPLQPFRLPTLHPETQATVHIAVLETG